MKHKNHVECKNQMETTTNDDTSHGKLHFIASLVSGWVRCRCRRGGIPPPSKHVKINQKTNICANKTEQQQQQKRSHKKIERNIIFETLIYDSLFAVFVE